MHLSEVYQQGIRVSTRELPPRFFLRLRAHHPIRPVTSLTSVGKKARTRLPKPTASTRRGGAQSGHFLRVPGLDPGPTASGANLYATFNSSGLVTQNLHVSGAGIVLPLVESSDNGPVQWRIKTDSENRRFVGLDSSDNVKSQVILADSEVKITGPTCSDADRTPFLRFA